MAATPHQADRTTVADQRALFRDGASEVRDAREVAAAHQEGVRTKVHELRALERSLVGFVVDCDAQCGGGPGPDCVILGELGRRYGCGPNAS